MTPRARLLMLILLGTLVAGAFYLRSLSRRVILENRPAREETVRVRLSEAALRAPSGASQEATLYFLSLDTRLLIAEKRPIEWATGNTDRIRQVLLELIQGSRQGHHSALPPTTEVRAVFLASDGTAYLDFSREGLANAAPGIASETLGVYSLVNSLAENIPAVKKVKILVQGQEAETLDGHADLTDYYVADPTLNASGS